MIDNFEQIKSLLRFDSTDDFYFLQIIKRKKEHPDMPKSVKVIATFYIPSIAKLEELTEEIIHMCEYHGARAYINLNKRSFEKMAFQMLKQVTDCILSKDYAYIRKSYNTVCGRFSNEDKDTKTWIIDVDTKDESFYDPLKKELELIEPVGEKVVAKIDTKNGYHIITKPFNKNKFDWLFNAWAVIPKPEIHTNNPTILYIP